MKRLMSMVAVSILGATIAVLAQAGSKPLTIVDLKGVRADGKLASPIAINSRGQIVAGTVGANPSRALLWECGVWTEIGTFGQAANAAMDINDPGQVVGSYGPDEADGRGFRWARGRMLDIGTLPDATFSPAWAINNRGQITGYSGYTPAGTTEIHAFLWERGAMTDLGTLGGPFSAGLGINDRGQVVGASTTAAGDGHAFLWEDGAMTDLGTLGGSSSNAQGINNRGQIVGWSGTALGTTHASLWENGAAIDLGTLPGDDHSEAYAINNRGQIVGLSLNAARFPRGVRAFLWNAGTMTNLGVLPGDDYSRAVSINERGDVVGMSEAHAVLWTNNPGALRGCRPRM